MKTILVPKYLIRDLEEAIAIDNRVNMNNLKIDVAAYFISLIISTPTYYREKGDNQDFARLSSIKLRQISYKYSHYLQFLIHYGFIIKVKNYSTDSKTCNTYSLSDLYLQMELIRYTIEYKYLSNKFKDSGLTQSQEERMDYVLERRPHLVASFNDNLSIDSIGACQEISMYMEKDFNRYRSASQLLLEWENKEWNYSVKTDTDNRLHTTLTRTNRMLRKYIRYNGFLLGAVDIRTSQPYFLAAILNGIIKRDVNYLKDLGVLEIVQEEVLYRMFDLDICAENVRLFTDMVLNNDLYQELVRYIPIVYQNHKPFRMVWPNGQYGAPKIHKYYDTERDLMKEVVLEVFNGSVKSRKTEVVEFKKIFPCIGEVLKCLDENGIQVFRLLSHVEAYCLLDDVASYIAEEYEEMPLFSIHDSLITTESNLLLLESEMEHALECLTGLKPKLKVEYWWEYASTLQE
ncbi:hypothetical protein SB49_07970 [Sediminicola sp. YIK13]|uniref:hypothetical protein n=1 Tax=Sediminicola sp. YIK13 TaxID=1453352 RepID=UPI00071F72E4|nr:hypothetical protein [Sediminicola sp. YIK13]ALM07747.1 hypothetical protein SB49_07970 [Sediminicola sp. YIK13]